MSVEGSIVPTRPEREKYKASVVLAMPEGLLKQGLIVLLETRGIQVTGLSSDAKTICEVLEYTPNGVFLVDTDLPNLNIVTLSGSIKGGNTKTILLGSEFHPAGLRLCQRFGVNNAVLRSDSPEDLAQTVLAVAKGCIYRSPRIAEAYKLASRQSETIETLTLREADVLKLLVQRYTNLEVAALLHLSVKTVETHRSHILDKTGNMNRVELAGIASCLIITAEQKPGGKQERYEYGQK